MTARTVACFLVLTGAVAGLVGHLARGRLDAPAAPPLQPVASVASLMRHVVEPHASAIFAAVGVTVGARGEVAYAPAGDEEWAALRRHAVMLAEAANLLRVRDRPVVEPGDARGHLNRMLWRDRETWDRHVDWLAEAAAWTLDAVERRNVIRLGSHAGDLALACELCHLHYRHPGASRRLDLPDR